MIAEPLAEGTSVMHRCHPAIRIVMAVIYSFTVALMSDLTGLWLALGFSMLLCLAAFLPLGAVLRRLAATGGLLLLVWLVVPWTRSGADEHLFSIGPMAISASGVRLCARISLKTFSILMAFTALVATMHLASLGQALHRLGAPAKLVHLLLLSYRYIFVLELEYRRLYRAAKIRNFQPATNIHTYKTYAYLLGMLFVRASERAVRVYHAMLCRGFNGRFHPLHRYAPTPWNAVLAGGIGLFSGLLIGLEWLR
jgi:cobalt/nickel transport system permease protein